MKVKSVHCSNGWSAWSQRFAQNFFVEFDRRDLFCKIQVWTLLPPLIDAQLHNIGGKYEYWFSLFSNFSSSFSLVGQTFYWKRYRNCCETFQCIFYVPKYETIFKTCFRAIKGSSDLKKKWPQKFFSSLSWKIFIAENFFRFTTVRWV